MMRDSTGVSPVIATILLIAITVVAVGVVMAFVAALPKPVVSVNTEIIIGGATAGSGTLTITHTGGDMITNAFDNSVSGTASWLNMQVRINGAQVPLTLISGTTYAATVTFNGSPIPSGASNFSVGDTLVLSGCLLPGVIQSTPLISGDVITVVYTPANQILVTVTVH
jgi:flagellin-like protein